MKLSTILKNKKLIIGLGTVALLLAILGTVLLYLVFLPKRYSEFVIQYAEEYGVEENLVFAVIRAESNFRADAVSVAGARGLMQLMPSTARFISENIGEKLDINSPKDNIRMGVWYLAYLQKKFNCATEMLAAYNAGEGAVRRWLQEERYTADGIHLQTIPIEETDKYVQRVKKFNNYYKIFY